MSCDFTVTRSAPTQEAWTLRRNERVLATYETREQALDAARERAIESLARHEARPIRVFVERLPGMLVLDALFPAAAMPRPELVRSA